MNPLTEYLARKRGVLAQRRSDYTTTPEAATITVKAASQVAGMTGARPIQMGAHRLLSDAAPGLAGHALGPSAPELLLGALASCLVHTYLIQAALLELPLADVEIEASAQLNMAGVVGMPYEEAPRLSDIRYQARLSLEAAPDQAEHLHRLVEATCPVLNTLKYACEVQRG
jgi:uncharacterized OsmC-like protein